MTKQTLLQLAFIFGFNLLFIQSVAQRFYWANADASSNFFTSSIRAIEVDSEDNIIAFGIIGDRYISETQDIFLDSSYNYFVAKYDPTGDLIWLETIGSSGFLSTTNNQIGLALDANDNIYVSAPMQVSRSFNFQGTIVSYGGNGSGSDTDVFLAKYDSDANLEFVVNQNADDSYPNALAVDDLGNIYLAGTFSGELNLDQTLVSTGGDDAFIAMYDQSGVPQWSYKRGNSASDESFDIKIEGASILWGTNIRTGMSPAHFHSVVEKFDATGTSVWSYTISATDSGQSMSGSALHSADNSVYIAGDFRESIEFPTSTAAFVLSTTPSNSQSFVAKLADGGGTVSFSWATQRGSTLGSDFSFDINKVLGRIFLLKRTSTDFQIERLSDSDGSLEASLSPDHPAVSYTYGYSLSINSTNDIYIGGYHNGNLKFGDEIKSSRGLFLTKTSATLGAVEWISAPLQHKKEIGASTYDEEGNMYVAGFMIGEFKSDSELLIGRGGNEGYIQKWSSAGELLYTRLHTSFFGDEVIKVKVVGNYLYATGIFDASDGSSVLHLDESTTISGEEDEEVYLVKYDLEGNLIWAVNAASTEGQVVVRDMEIDANGNVYLHGDALGGSPKDFGNGITYGPDEFGSFVAKYDEDGLTQWVRINEGTKSDAIGIVGNQIIVGGRFESNIDFEGNALIVDGTNDIYLASYSLDGTFQWVKQLGGGSWEYMTAVSTNETDGSIFLSGYYYDEFSIESESLIGERREAFIAKYNAQGDFIWLSGGGGSRDDYFYGLDLDTIGNPYAIGKYEGSAIFGSQTFTGFGDRDIQAFIIGYDKLSGEEIYATEYGHPTDYIEGDDDDYFNTISIDQNNDYFLTGDFIDEVALDTIQLPDDGNNTFFLTKMSLSDCAYVGEVSFDVFGASCASETMLFIDNSDLGAHEIVEWTWDFGDGLSSNEQHPSHTYESGGDYTVVLTVNYFDGSCQLSTSSIIEIRDAQSVSAGVDIEVCRTSQILLDGSMGGATTQIVWTTLGDGTFNDPTDPKTSYTAGPSDLSTGFVELVISSNSGNCMVDRDTLNVTIRDEASVNAGIDQEVCYNEGINVNGSYSGTSSILWTTTGDGSFTNPSQGATTYISGASDLIDGEVQLVLSSDGGGCEIARDTLIVTILEELIIDAGDGHIICDDAQAQLSATVQGSLASLWSTTGDGTFDNPNLVNPTYTPGSQDLTNGSVTLTISTSGNTCEEISDDLILSFQPTKKAEDYTLELASGRASQQILTADEVATGFSIQVESEPVGGKVTIENGMFSYILEDPSISSDSFTYSIHTQCGVDFGQIDIVNLLGSVEIYNVVTPNGDGQHDFLKIKSIESYPENSLSIFDRTGKVVFSTVGYNSENVFEGKSDAGKELPEGNYYYRLKIPTLELDLSGFLLLKR